MHDGWSWSLAAVQTRRRPLENPKASSERQGAFGRSDSGLTPGQQAAVERAFQRATDNRRGAPLQRGERKRMAGQTLNRSIFPNHGRPAYEAPNPVTGNAQ